MTVSAYPLQWPVGWPRTKDRKPSQFRTQLNGALTNARTSLHAFGKDTGADTSGVVISSNVSLGVDAPADPGVAVWFSWNGELRCIAVDRYRTPAENLQAIHLVLEARRTEIRHAGVVMARASMAGFTAALPSPGSKHWSAVLGVGRDASLSEIEAAWRRLAAERHPDKPGGSDAEMADLNRARDEARKERG